MHLRDGVETYPDGTPKTPTKTPTKTSPKAAARVHSKPTDEPHGYEFGGPLGALGVSVGLPVLVYSFAFLCNDKTGCPVPSLLDPKTATLESIKRESGWLPYGWQGLISWEVTCWVLGYYVLSLVLQVVLPGVETQGTVLKNGKRLKYKFNAFNSAIFVLSVLAAGTSLRGANFPVWTFIWDKYVQIITVNLLVAFFLALFVYVRSFSVKPLSSSNRSLRELAAGGHSGNILYDWFIGRELNPRVTLPLINFEVDIKAFFELRPGMLGWLILDLAFMAHQYNLHGLVSDSMLLINAFQALYILDALWMEPAILTTMDITTDGFGFMLAFGDIAWLPFIYSVQARYLAVHPVHLGLGGIAGVLAVQGLGYYIFRASNNEKNRFRTNPNDPRVRHLKYIETASGSRLLVSGWWGTARHINYLGDWIMAWSYCLPTGMAGYLVNRPTVTGFRGVVASEEVVQGRAKGWGMVFTYFYLLYFAVLLIHREMRDEEKCAKKYGADWEEYKKRVKYRILPYVY